MKFEYFIARRIVSSGKSTQRFSKSVIRIAILAITLGIAVMILATSIVSGFQRAVRNKVIGFGSHIQIVSYKAENNFEYQPINKNQSFYPEIDTVKGIRHIQVFATKAGIMKTKNNIQGVVLKGISTDFDWSFFSSKIVKGRKIEFNDSAASNDLLISEAIANKLKLKVGEDVPVYFIQKPPRVRKFKICGLYKTGLPEKDNVFVFCDIKHIQKLNNWDSTQVSGFEVLINNFDDLDTMTDFVYTHIPQTLNVTNIKEENGEIFNWLELQNMNVRIILILMTLVAAINIISALLVLILERTQMIGVLKSLGTSNWSIQRIFIFNAAYLVFIGLLIGDILGVGLAYLQWQFHLMKLPEASYYISYVPINFSWLNFLLINVGTFIICVIMLLIPSYVVTKISPVKAIRFE